MANGMVFAAFFMRKEERAMIEVIIGLLMLLGLIVMFAISIGLSGIIIAFYIVGGLIGLVFFWGVISVIWYWIRRLYYGVTGKTPPDDIGEVLGYKQIEAFNRALERGVEKARENYEKSKYGDSN